MPGFLRRRTEIGVTSRYSSSLMTSSPRSIESSYGGTRCIASSVSETQISVEAARTTGDRKINRLPFGLERLLCSHYEYEKPQELYFVIESYRHLAALFTIDLGAFIMHVLDQLRRGEKTMIPQGTLLPGEDAILIPPNPPRG